MQSVALIAEEYIPGDGYILCFGSDVMHCRLCNATDVPIAISANWGETGRYVQANALEDQIYTLRAAMRITNGDVVEVANGGSVRPFIGNLRFGRAASSAESFGRQIKVSVETSETIGAEGGGIGNIWIAPGTLVPNGNVIGYARGQTYAQLDAGGTYILRQWVFAGTAGEDTGWL